MSTELVESTSTFPPTGEEHPVASYKAVLAATRDLSNKFPWEEFQNFSKAFLLLETEYLAQKDLDRIKEEIDNQLKPWNLDRYHRDVLLSRSNDNTPDGFFSRHAGTKPRLILRLTAKVILPNVKSLLSAPELVHELISTFKTAILHEQIEAYITRWDQRDTQSKLAEQAGKKLQKKRQRGEQCFGVGNMPC